MQAEAGAMQAKGVEIDPGKVDEILGLHSSDPSSLIMVLQDIQREFSFLPSEALQRVSESLGVPIAKIHAVSTFYKAFSLKPRGKHTLTVCMGTACHVRGANPLLEEALTELAVAPGETTEDGLFTVESVNCLGACALGPVVVLDGVYCHHMTPMKLRDLIESVRQADQGKQQGDTDTQETKQARSAG